MRAQSPHPLLSRSLRPSSPSSPPSASSPSSPPPSRWPRGAVSTLEVGALLCEHSLITSVLPTASRGSQHGVRTALSVKRRERISTRVLRQQSCRLQSVPFPVSLDFLFFSQPETINGVLDQSSLLVFVCVFSAGDAPFTALHLYLSPVLALVTWLIP